MSASGARYVAIITDGNGRWAQNQGLPVVEGHRAGADTVKARLREVFDLRPFAIIRELDLLHPIYRPTASYGHFGREPYALNGATAFSWERTDKADALKAALS